VAEAWCSSDSNTRRPHPLASPLPSLPAACIVLNIQKRTIFCSACKVSSYKKFTFAILSPDEFLYLKVVTHKKVFFRKSLSKVTFERNLACVSWKLSPFFFFRKKLSRLEHVLFLQVSFHKLLSKATFERKLLVCHYLYIMVLVRMWKRAVWHVCRPECGDSVAGPGV